MSKHISIRIPDDLDEIIDKFCKEEDRTKSWFVKKAIQEKLEDWEDLRDGLKALKEHKRNPQITSHEDLIKELGITKEDLK